MPSDLESTSDSGNTFLSDKISENKSSQNYSCSSISCACPLCTLTFTSEESLYRHLNNYHGCLPSAFKCHLCETVYQNRSAFLDHIETLHSSSHNLHLIIMYKCMTCDFTTGREDDLKKHIEIVHLPTPASSPNHQLHDVRESVTGGATLLLKDQIHHHQTNQDPENPKCLQCDFIFENEAYLMEHVQSIHETASIHQCNYCDLSLQTEGLLDLHIQSCHGMHPPVIHCNSCDYTCIGMSLLNIHIRESHCIDPTSELLNPQCMKHTCYKCGKPHQTDLDLLNHLQACHQHHFLFHCNHCGESFADERDFNTHTNAAHSDVSTTSTGLGTSLLRNDPSVLASSCENLEICPEQCPTCAKTFDPSVDLREHLRTCHGGLSLQSDAYEEHIPQYDGPNQDLYEFSNVPSFSTIRKAAYSLNPQKQTEKIKEDAVLNDFDVNVNNSDQNATVKCSSGFYIQVARASLGTLNTRSVLSCGDIAVTVDEVTVTKDLTGLEATKLLSLSFMSDQKLLGGVKVHLHHSTRTIQIQGSYNMPDNTRAALWFLNNFVLIRFKELAKAKSFSIKNTNSAILSAPSSRSSGPKIATTSSNSCQSCNSLFDTRSKPSKCINCGKFLHKTGCLKEHMKLCSRPVVIPQTLSITSSSSSSSLTTQAVTNSRLVASPSPSTVTTTPTTQPSMIGLKTLVSFVPSSGSEQPVPLSSHTAGGALPSPTLLPAFSPTTPGVPGPSKVPKKKKKPAIPMTPDEATINFLKTELGAAQTRIVELDAEIKDKDQRVAVLWARVQILEEKQNKDVLDKYFPHQADPNKPGPTSSIAPPKTQIPSPPSCPGSCAAPPPTLSGTCCTSHCKQQLTHWCSPCPYQTHAPSHSSSHRNHPCSTESPTESHNPSHVNLVNRVEVIADDILAMKAVLVELQNLQANCGAQHELPSVQEKRADDEPEKQLRDSTASVASVEEFMDDIDELEISVEQLNCQVPTNHLL